MAAAGLAAALAGCAAPSTLAPTADGAAVSQEALNQRRLVADRIMADQARLHAVTWKIAAANADLCGEKVAWRSGIAAATIRDFEGEWAGVAVEKFALDDRVTVTIVTPGSPAEAAGLRVKDKIVSIDGGAAPAGKRASEKLHEALEKALEGGRTVTLGLVRDGQPVTAALTPAKVCAPHPVYVDTQELNAYADGENIFITRGMMRFLPEDKELALVVAHELAHNSEGHIDAKRTNAMAGAAGGLLLDVLAAAAGVNTQGAFSDAGARAASQAYGVEFEQEADYVGMYFLSRSGYPMDGVEDVWRKMAAEHPESIYSRNSHPTAPERFLAIGSARSEISTKRTGGAALMPNRKPQPTS
ncbi:MAG TPA: M48 family metallopeptidase [Azospirillaceae bacterium]|nr:M48 family metallopeptidase [Azospirillaceae bacterium]